jgi:phosphatidylserine decarboxylase
MDMRVAKEGLRFIVPATGLAAVFGIVGLGGLAAFFVVLAAALVFFFRDPDRVPPAGGHLLVSPADGEVLGVEPVETPPGLDGPATKLTIFLALYNVHLVRAPFAATVASAEYHPGKFLPAYKPEAGAHNESQTLILKSDRLDAVLKMIVGVAARRIKCFVQAGEAVERGQRIGLMFFGSRVELVLPRSASVKVGLHDRVKAGETVIAEVQP